MSENETQCTLFNKDIYKCNVIIALKRTTGSLSLVGCCFMIGTIWLFRKYTILSQRLILYLSIAALFDAIGYIIGDMTPDGTTCDFEAWWMTYFDWTVLMWVSCITFNLYMNVVKQRRTEKYEKFYHLLSWVCPPLLFSLLPLIGDNYGPAGAWCWIKHTSTVWRFLIWYVPLFLLILAMFGGYSYIIYFLKKRISSWQGTYDPDEERTVQLIKEDIKVLKAYPFIFLILSIFPFILRIHNAFTAEGTDIFGLWVMTALTAPLQGAVNAVVFGLDPETRTKLTWAQIQLAWASRFSHSAVHEYPTVFNNPLDSPTSGESVINPVNTEAVRRSSSFDQKQRYGSLNLEEN
uniref:Cyclic AMP receptor 3-like n=1 Tax=Ciona intestinalis TaxID=7719 RepID=F6TIH6_CIOIN|nr:cyclic AMP receptor 3-like [Ciona intestinalis]|eukprot:XP_002129104.1 cyclic AMP receptor 3-like [Ciona intestinalis]